MRGFAGTWKAAVESLSQDVMRSFTNFKNGTSIIQVGTDKGGLAGLRALLGRGGGRGCSVEQMSPGAPYASCSSCTVAAGADLGGGRAVLPPRELEHPCPPPLLSICRGR